MQCPNVEVVAVLLARDQRLLAVLNPRWGAFTFPMSKRKQFADSSVSQLVRPEPLNRAASRVAAEILGHTFAPADMPKPLKVIKDFEQNDVDGIWKLYTIHVFGLNITDEPRLAPGVIAEWLEIADFDVREPVTHTARYLLNQLREAGLQPPWA